MSTESEIQAEIESLKDRFSETKALYREVCALLFFRYGITPTASKLYQYVRKGSMSAPADALAKFWEELRGKARVQIDHPDLPEALKVAAADAVQTLWGQATELARTELTSARLEMQEEADQCRAGRDAAEQAVVRMHAAAEHLRADVERVEAETRAMRHELEAERREHAGTQARVAQMQNQLDEGSRQQQALQDGFAAELGKARETVDAANERAAGAERRALKEIEQERQARARADKAIEDLRDKLAAAEGRERQQSLIQAETVTRLQMELNAAIVELRRAQETREDMQGKVAGLVQQLSASQAAVARHQAEAQTLQGLVERLTSPPTPVAATATTARSAPSSRKKTRASGT